MTTPAAGKPPAGEYAVGHGKPPKKSQFRKGQSGNPGGRPRGMTTGRAKALALKEAYRMVRVREGDRVVCVPALGAILRSLVALAAKGNAPAQRFVYEELNPDQERGSAIALPPDASIKPISQRRAGN
jgi:hypothetical protein